MRIQDVKFIKSNDINELDFLKTQWLNSLSSPQDDMWEFFRNNSTHWKISDSDKAIGYLCLNEHNTLIQFFIVDKYLPVGEFIFKKLLSELSITKGIVGTNNPIFSTFAFHFVKELKIKSYLFRDYNPIQPQAKEGKLNVCKKDDLIRVINFYHYSINASKDWLEEYLTGLVHKNGLYFFENKNKIIGVCEVRKRTTSPECVDIGMVISPDFRKQGYGTYLLHLAKEIALKWHKKPICSCDKDNIGSLKAIQNCGFTSKYQLLEIEFVK